MNNFSSFLELMAAFNFAYVLGQDYLKEVLLKGLGIAGRIEVKTNDRITELKTICDNIINHKKEENEEGKDKIKQNYTRAVFLVTELRSSFDIIINHKKEEDQGEKALLITKLKTICDKIIINHVGEENQDLKAVELLITELRTIYNVNHHKKEEENQDLKVVESLIIDLRTIYDDIISDKKKIEQDKKSRENAIKKIKDSIILSLEKLQQSYTLDFSSKSIPFGFPQLCLIGGVLCMYSILVESFNGSNIFWSTNKFSVICHLLFSIYSGLLYLFFLVLTLYPKVNQWAINKKFFVSINSKICIVSLVILVLIYLSVLFPSITDWFIDWPTYETDKELFCAKPESMTVDEANKNGLNFQITEKVATYHIISYLSILVLPILHFFIFLRKASKKGVSVYKDFQKELQDIEEQYKKIKNDDDYIMAGDSRYMRSNYKITKPTK